MSVIGFVLIIVTGLLVGWVAGENLGQRGLGMEGSVYTGIVGAIIGGAVLMPPVALRAYGLPGSLVMAVLVATALLSLTWLVRRDEQPLIMNTR